MFSPGGRNEWWRFASCVAFLAVAALVVGVRIVMLHLDWVSSHPKQPKYGYKDAPPALRGTIYSADGQVLAKTHFVWEYRLDPRAALWDPKHPKQPIPPAVRMQKMRLVSEKLNLPLARVMDAYANLSNRYQFVARNESPEIHDALAARTNYLHELSFSQKQVRDYPQGRLLAHVLGYVLRDPTNDVGCAGIEQRYERVLKAVKGEVRGTKDAHGREDRSRRKLDVVAKSGCDVYLTIDQNLQYEVEKCLREGLAEHKAERAWAVMLSVRTGAVLAMAGLPDYDPARFWKCSTNDLKNPVIAQCYEPGSVMKTITAAACLNEGIVTPDTMINTARNDPAYYKLPGDAGHVWEETMSVRDALVHSSNIVYGKLGVNLGRVRLWSYMKAFGFGRRSEIDLRGEETGILRKGETWDLATCSRAPIGQGVSVTAIQLAAAYAAIGNDGRLMRPYLVDRILQDGTNEIHRTVPICLGEPIRADVARQVRAMMTGVAKKGGTARRAAVPGYTVAGKTGTAQLPEGRGYSTTKYNASFIGIIPATRPEVVILVTFNKPFYCRSRTTSEECGVPLFNHQGGLCAAPVFSRIAEKTMRYLEVEPDIPDEVPDVFDDQP